MQIPSYEILTSDILKAKLYTSMKDRNLMLEIVATATGRWLEPVDCSEAFKDNEEADLLVKKKYGTIKFLGGDN